MPENVVDVANFAAGTRDAPAFEGSGGASRMLNYLVDFDGEVVPRPGYAASNDEVTHLVGGAVDPTSSQKGPIFLVETDSGVRQMFRIAKGATYVLQKNRFYVAEPDDFSGGYWVDLSQGAIKRETSQLYIHRWGQSPFTSHRPGDRESSGIQAKSVSLNVSGLEKNDGGRSSFRYGYNKNLLPIPVIHMTVTLYKNVKFDIKIYDSVGREVQTFQKDQDGKAGVRYDYTWDSRSQRNEHGEKFAIGVYYPSLQESESGKVIEYTPSVSHPLFVGLNGYPQSPDNPLEIRMKIDDTADVTHGKFELKIRRDDTLSADDILWEKKYSASDIKAGQEIKEIWRGEVKDDENLRYVSAEEYEDVYFEVIFGDDVKRRYYLFGHRESGIGGQVSASLQAGYQIYQLGSAFGPKGQAIGAAAGAVVAAGGSVAALVGKATEGDRVEIRSHRTDITPAIDDESGFYPGIIAYTCTYSDTPERLVESLPSKVGSLTIYDFQGLDQGARTAQGVNINLPDRLPVEYKFLNIYAARVDRFLDSESLPQSTGLTFRLIAQIPRAGDRWVNTDEGVYKWRNESAIDPSLYLNQFDNDPPPSQLSDIVSYGSRIWGVNREDETIVYSKLAPYGYHHFPFENALVPQSIALDDSHSKIVRIFPAPNDSMLYVFKRDRIHFIRGGGEIQGLHSPTTPVDVNIDASIKKENVGTYAPRSITTLKDTVLFLGSDKILYELAGMRVRAFSISIQPHIEKYSDEELENVIAFEYRNCYHLCLPNEVLVLDLQKKYWTLFDWKLRDIFWAQDSGRSSSENTLYAINADDELIELYKGDKDGESDFVCEWESNPIRMSYRQILSGCYVFHDESVKHPLSVGVKVDNGDYETRAFVPANYNRFRQGFHKRGHRVQIKVRDANPKKLRIDRIQIGVQNP